MKELWRRFRYRLAYLIASDWIDDIEKVSQGRYELLEMVYKLGIEKYAWRLNEEAEKVYIDREGDFVEADGEIYDTVADWCKKTSDNLLEEMVGDNE